MQDCACSNLLSNVGKNDIQPWSEDCVFFPHISVWGSCFWLCTPGPPPASSPSRHMPTTWPHTTYSHTTCPHTTYPHTHNIPTHNLLTHTQKTHTQLTHTQKTHTQLTHTHTTCSQPPGTWRQTPSLCVADVAFGDIDLHFAWQVWHLVTSTFTLRGRCGTWWHRPPLCVAGVALGDIDLHFAWQAWHLVTSTFTLRGKCGTWWHGSALCVAGVAFMALGWLWWRLGLVGTAALCVAGVALGDIDLHFAWQAWHLVTSTFTLRGRCGTWWHGSALCVGGAAFMALGWLWWRGAWVWRAPRHFAWQAWRLVTSTFTLRGRRGTWWHRPSLCVAGVALGDMDLHFVWQAWHLWHWAGCGGAWVWRVPRHFAWQAWRLVMAPRSWLHNILHPQHFHTRLFHTHTHARHFYTPHLYTHFFHQHTFTRNSFTHLTLTCISYTHRSSTIFSPSYLSHPIFTFLWLLIGRSWHVGLSGPFIFLVNSLLWPALNLHPFILAHDYKILTPSLEWKAASIAYLLDTALNVLCTDCRHRL